MIQHMTLGTTIFHISDEVDMFIVCYADVEEGERCRGGCSVFEEVFVYLFTSLFVVPY